MTANKMTADEAYNIATELIESDIRELSAWAMDFIEDIQLRFDGNVEGPSEKQAAKLNTLYERHIKQ